MAPHEPKPLELDCTQGLARRERSLQSLNGAGQDYHPWYGLQPGPVNPLLTLGSRVIAYVHSRVIPRYDNAALLTSFGIHQGHQNGELTGHHLLH